MYAIGVVSGEYKAKKNVELVARLRQKAQRFPFLRFVKVAGHAGVAENERCDQLASEAIARRR
jgi:ribonuclease HI